jgi:hypothetical protein
MTHFRILPCQLLLVAMLLVIGASHAIPLPMRGRNVKMTTGRLPTVPEDQPLVEADTTSAFNALGQGWRQKGKQRRYSSRSKRPRPDKKGEVQSLDPTPRPRKQPAFKWVEKFSSSFPSSTATSVDREGNKYSQIESKPYPHQIQHPKQSGKEEIAVYVQGKKVTIPKDRQDLIYQLKPHIAHEVY